MKYYNRQLSILVCIFVVLQCNRPTPAVPGQYTGDEDHSISLEEAAKMTSKYKAQNPESPYAWYFGAKAIEKILDQEGCVGIRIYGGVDEKGHVSPVIVGVLSSGANLEKGELAERAAPCPPDCGASLDLLNQ